MTLRRIGCILLLIMLGYTGMYAQSPHYQRKQYQGYIQQKLVTFHASDTSNIHQGLGNVWRSDLLHVVDQGLGQDSTLLNYLAKDNPEYVSRPNQNVRPGILRHFYKDGASLLSVEQDHFAFYLNPILNVSAGREQVQDDLVFRNTRGFQLRGYVNDKVYFYTDLLETQANFLSYQKSRFDTYSAIDGQGFFKPYNSSVSALKGYDFLNARGYLGVPITQNITFEIGHGNHFVGHGYHSLLLNDYGNNYFYVSLDTRVWKLHYKNVFAELAAQSSNLTGSTFLLPKKYMAAHYLSYKPARWLEVGLYEAVVFSREDHFEFQYLNPIILYRTVEQFLDSPDNVLLGLNWKIQASQTWSIYGQVLLDELKIGELFDDAGWWGNKYAVQVGSRLYNAFGISGLDLQAEYNIVRPFTYSHLWPLEDNPTISTSNYSHFSQTLAHPLGSNFQEVLINLRYQYNAKLFATAKVFYAQKGFNSDGINYGSDILLPNGSRDGNFGHSLLQGQQRDIMHASLELNYMLYHNIVLKSTVTLHDDSATGRSRYFGISILVNSFDYQLDY